MKNQDLSGEQIVQQRFATAGRAAAFTSTQLLDHLNVNMQEFVTRQDLLFIATSNATGSCDCSFRAGQPGFVHVLNAKQLAIPEYRGNGVFASLGNIVENPNIGIMFLDLYHSTIGLHVNGRARVFNPEEMRLIPNVPSSILESSDPKSIRCLEAWILVDVKEAFIHCSKHVPLMKRLDKQIAWGSDEESVKGGDYFGVRAEAKLGKGTNR
jgi:predicted pyridoxine 5'-phosphate oxidase superfamily flavin-nucleotide-binding protein